MCGNKACATFLFLMLCGAVGGASEDSETRKSFADLSSYRPFVVGSEMTPPVKVSGSNPDLSDIEDYPVVVLAVFISDSGNVDGIFFLNGAGTRTGHRFAASVLNWEFEPATLEGEPIAIQYILTLKF